MNNCHKPSYTIKVNTSELLIASINTIVSVFDDRVGSDFKRQFYKIPVGKNVT